MRIVAAMSQPEYLILAFTGALIARFTYFKGRAWEFMQSHGDALVSALRRMAQESFSAKHFPQS